MSNEVMYYKSVLLSIAVRSMGSFTKHLLEVVVPPKIFGPLALLASALPLFFVFFKEFTTNEPNSGVFSVTSWRIHMEKPVRLENNLTRVQKYERRLAGGEKKKNFMYRWNLHVTSLRKTLNYLSFFSITLRVAARF